MSNLFNPTNFRTQGTPQDGRFPDPFMDMASLAMPSSISDILKWCEFLLSVNNVYRQALSRTISYFITDVEVTSHEGRIGQEERDKLLNFLNDTLGIKSVLYSVLADRLCYGNSFTSLLIPFRRYLACPKCAGRAEDNGHSARHTEVPLRKIYNTPSFNFKWSNFQFHAKCPNCEYYGPWRHVDRRSGEHGQLKVKRWNPHEIDIIHDPYTEDCAYVWKIPAEERQLVSQGHLHQLERTSWEIIQAVQNNENLLFDPGIIFHMKEEHLAGQLSKGWGVSRVLTNFRQAWLVQILNRYNEQICLDHIVPNRVLTPMPRSGGDGTTTDPYATIGGGNFVAWVNRMVRDHRRDPGRIHVSPFPLQQTIIGGDAKNLAPRDLLDQAQDTLLTGVGVPVEFYKGSLSVQAAPAALRLFEANWSGLTHDANKFLGNLVEQLCRLFSWEPTEVRLARVTHADDLNRQMAKLQLMMGGQASQTSGLRSVGMDFQDEQRQLLEEQRFVAEEQQKMQDEMTQGSYLQSFAKPQPGGQQAAAGGAPPPQGGAGAMGMPFTPSAVDQFIAQKQTQPNVPVTMEDMQSQAQIIANDLVAKPDSIKRSEMAKLKRSNESMHAMVGSVMSDIRRQMQLQGGEQMMQATYGQKSAAQLLARAYGKPLRHMDLR